MLDSRTRRSLLALALGVAGACAALGLPSASGPTGGLTTPNPLTLRPGSTDAGVHVEAIHVFDPSSLSVETVFASSPKVVVGIYDYMELGVEQTFRINDPRGNDNLTINGKYRFPFDTFNVAVGAIAPVQPPDWTSIYMTMGWKAIWGGFGVNVGGRQFRELTIDNFVNVGVSKLGGYTLKRQIINGSDNFVGQPDIFYGLFGFDYMVAQHLELLGDYNGDRFTAGFRIPFHSVAIDLGYVTQRAQDTLFNRQTLHWMVGFTGHW